MKVLLLLAAVLVTVSAIPTGNQSEPNGWYVPTGDGFEWVSKHQFENEIAHAERRSTQVKYYLYTKYNPTNPKQLYLDDIGTLSASNFRGSLPTRVIIHGWENDYRSKVNTYVGSAYLNSGSYNVICVDWSDKAQTLNYMGSRLALPDVGRQVANFLDFLSAKGGMSFNQLTLIGHSLGAHVAGYTGKQVTRGKVNTIVGLDPAHPLFSISECSTRLCRSDATHVEAIHTSGRILGFLEPIGHADFYPNGGKRQPGCGMDIAGTCAHRRSYMYFAEAIQRNSFKSIPCSDYEAATKNRCNNFGFGARMGVSYGNSGIFYVPVHENSPYGTD